MDEATRARDDADVSVGQDDLAQRVATLALARDKGAVVRSAVGARSRAPTEGRASPTQRLERARQSFPTNQIAMALPLAQNSSQKPAPKKPR